MMNNFKRLEEEGFGHYRGPRQEKIHSGINSTLGTVRFVGRIVDVYLSRMVDTIIGITGGDMGGQRPGNSGDRRPPNDPVTDILGPQGPIWHGGEGRGLE